MSAIKGQKGQALNGFVLLAAVAVLAVAALVFLAGKAEQTGAIAASDGTGSKAVLIKKPKLIDIKLELRKAPLTAKYYVYNPITGEYETQTIPSTVVPPGSHFEILLASLTPDQFELDEFPDPLSLSSRTRVGIPSSVTTKIQTLWAPAIILLQLREPSSGLVDVSRKAFQLLYY